MFAIYIIWVRLYDILIWSCLVGLGFYVVCYFLFEIGSLLLWDYKLLGHSTCFILPFYCLVFLLIVDLVVKDCILYVFLFFASIRRVSLFGLINVFKLSTYAMLICLVLCYAIAMLDVSTYNYCPYR